MINIYAIYFKQYLTDLLHLLENTFDRKRISAQPSSDPNPKFNPNLNPISTLKAPQYRFSLMK